MGKEGRTYVSKKLMGDLKMANAILSWSFREAYGGNHFSFRPVGAYAHNTR